MPAGARWPLSRGGVTVAHRTGVATTLRELSARPGRADSCIHLDLSSRVTAKLRIERDALCIRSRRRAKLEARAHTPAPEASLFSLQKRAAGTGRMVTHARLWNSSILERKRLIARLAGLCI